MYKMYLQTENEADDEKPNIEFSIEDGGGDGANTPCNHPPPPTDWCETDDGDTGESDTPLDYLIN